MKDKNRDQIFNEEYSISIKQLVRMERVHWKERQKGKGRVEDRSQVVSRNEDAWRRLESVTYTVFVDNLPLSMSKSWLWQLFNYEGRVVDVFISHKKRKTCDAPFAFVRFDNLKGAQDAIHNLNGMEVRGCKLTTSMAEYRRHSGRRVEQSKPNVKRGGNIDNGANRTGRSYKDVVIHNMKQPAAENDRSEKGPNRNKREENEKYDKTRVVYGVGNQQLMEELGRSAIGESVKPVDTQAVEEAVKDIIHSVEKVRQMGAYKVLLTFNSIKNKDDFLGRDESTLRGYFAEVRNWTMKEVCQTRCTWVECFGVPIHGWCEENFRRIAEQLGTVVQCDNQVAQMSHFNSAKVLIDTCYYPFIQECVYLSINGFGYDVHVKEVACQNSAPLHFQTLEESRRNSCSHLQKEKRDVSSSIIAENIEVKSRAWEIGATSKWNELDINCAVGKSNNEKEVERQEGGLLLVENGSQTMALEDDRRTEQVMRDLGLVSNGPKNESLVAKAYKEWSKIEEHEDTNGPRELDPPIPPGFENDGPAGSGGISCSYVPNSILVEENRVDDSVIDSPDEGSDDNSSGNQSEDNDQHAEANATWRVGRKLGLETEHDGDAIQAIFEEKKEWRKGKRREAKKKKGKQNNKARNGPGESKRFK